MLLDLDCCIHLSLWCNDYTINIDYDVNFECVSHLFMFIYVYAIKIY
jgi:hypothetical protein